MRVMKPDSKSEGIYIKVEQDIRRKIQEMASDLKMPVSVYIRLLLAQHTRTPLKIILERKAG